uniref:Uncharacterized protein n=1 Tax=Romanomermis culicivorax TaxID=13658 RepID=A0A915I2D4_ROMCU
MNTTQWIRGAGWNQVEKSNDLIVFKFQYGLMIGKMMSKPLANQNISSLKPKFASVQKCLVPPGPGVDLRQEFQEIQTKTYFSLGWGMYASSEKLGRSKNRGKTLRRRKYSKSQKP